MKVYIIATTLSHLTCVATTYIQYSNSSPISKNITAGRPPPAAAGLTTRRQSVVLISSRKSCRESENVRSRIVVNKKSSKSCPPTKPMAGSTRDGTTTKKIKRECSVLVYFFPRCRSIVYQSSCWSLHISLTELILLKGHDFY
jgi:hypothetical protein